MFKRSSTFSFLFAAAVAGWLVPLLGYSLAFAFSRGSYLPGEEISPRDQLEIGAIFVGLLVAGLTFIACYAVPKSTHNRLTSPTRIISGVYILFCGLYFALLHSLFNAL